MKNTSKIILVITFLLGVWWWRYTPDSLSIVSAMELTDQGISYDAVSYELKWQNELSEYGGNIHEIVKEYNKIVPFNTHHTVITTGDFSDPGKVEIKPLGRGGHTSWRAKSPPSGKLIVLHLVPKNTSIYEKIQGLGEGQKVSFFGYEETDGYVQNSSQLAYSFGSKSHGHILFLVTDIQFK